MLLLVVWIFNQESESFIMLIYIVILQALFDYRSLFFIF